MPYSIRKLPKKNLYRVYNTKTKEVHSYATTLENAKKQVTLLHMVDAGVPLQPLKKVAPNERMKRVEVSGGSIQRPKLLEMFKGTGSVGKQAKKMGFQVTSLDFDPIYTPDIETDILDWDYKKYSTENNYIPDMIWSSPPCNTFSPMVYRLKERNVETAKPLSERARIGTKILYRTLEIIEYFLKKNPKLLFVIENPRGMMRKDARMKKLERETTLYCLYGDFKRKSTDFWNNFPQGLKLDQETKQCPNATIPVQISKGVKNLNLDQRYSMPSKLIKHFLEEFKKQYGSTESSVANKVGGSIETDRFERNGIVSLPEFQSIKVELPTYMYKRMPDIQGKPPPYRYRLVNPITSARNISSRLQNKSIDIKRKPISQPFTFYEESEDLPTINDFSPDDREKIETYYNEVEKNEKKDRDEIENQPANNLPRGFPLPCDNPKPKKPKPVKVSKEKKVKEPNQRGRPKKQQRIEIEGEKDDLFAILTEKEIESRTPSVSSKSKSSKKSLSELSSLSSLAKESETSKSSKSSAKSVDTIDTGEMSLGSEDVDDFLKKYGIKGMGIENNILSNNKMANSWVSYVKDYASKNGMSYRDALRDPKCKAGYKKGAGGYSKGVYSDRGSIRGAGVVDELGDQDVIADAYNSSQLGANAGRKFISL